MEMIEAIKAIGAAKGKSKVDVIKSFDGETTTALKQVVTLALDPFLSYYMKEIPEYVPSLFDTHGVDEYRWVDAVDQLMFISGRGGARAEDKDKLARICCRIPCGDGEVLKLIVSRDLKCGAGLGTFRKVWGEDFLPEMEYALMAPFNENKITKVIKFPAYSQLKSDGARSIWTGRNGVIEPRSRNGRPMLLLDHIKAVIEARIPKHIDYDVDGELVVLDEDGNILPRAIGNGIINKAIKGTISPEQASRIILIAWDLIVFTGDAHMEDLYEKRLHDLDYIFRDSNLVRITENRIVGSLAEAKEHYRELVLRGEEGSILKNMDSLWTPGDTDAARSANGFKFKEVFPAEFEITGWYYGEKGKKYENAIGGFTYKSACGKVSGSVGSGLTDKIRFDENPDRFIGTVFEMKYNGRTVNEDCGGFTLFLPRIVEQREDKTEADTLEKLIAQEDAARQLGM